jgi:hypothetical protein
MTDHLDLTHLGVALGGVGVDHLVDDRIELLLRRLPRLEQVVVHVDDVDRGDRGIGVGVRG